MKSKPLVLVPVKHKPHFTLTPSPQSIDDRNHLKATRRSTMRNPEANSPKSPSSPSNSNVASTKAQEKKYFAPNSSQVFQLFQVFQG